MPRRMSCSLTTDAVRMRTKTVTRRHVDTWRAVAAGDRLILVEKAMGLPKGAKQVVLAEVEIVSNDIVRLSDIDEDDCAREGFPDMTPAEFVDFWAHSHRVHWANQSSAVAYQVRRIEWRYLDEAP